MLRPLRPRPKTATVVLLVLIVAAVLIPAGPVGHARAGDFLVPEDWRRAHPGPYTISVAVVMDEEWTEKFGPDAGSQAEAVISAASRHLGAADVHLRPVSYGGWASSESAADIVDLLGSLEAAYPGAEADLVIGLTAGYRKKEGGVSRPRGSHVIVKHHPYRLDRDAYILAHEIGHVLGLHPCDDNCDCFMMHGKYDPEKHWCAHHLALLRANGGYFQYIASHTT